MQAQSNSIGTGSTRRIIHICGIAVCGLILLCGCDKQQQQATAPPAPKVEYVTLAASSIQLTTKLPGRTTPFRVAEIRPQVSGLLQKRLFTEGSNVQAGQILYQIDPAPFQAVLANARAALGRAEANLPATKARVERYQKMLAINAVSQQDYDDAVSALNQLEADIQYYRANEHSALINLDYTKIVAPIAGRIGRSNVTDGAIVTAYQGLPLATIQQLDPIYVDIPQSTTDLLRLQRRLQDGRLHRDNKQSKVKLLLPSDHSYPLEGTLQFSDITVDPTTASVTLRTLFPNPDNILLPGMFLQTVINEGVNTQALLIPQQGVARDPKGNPYALVVDEQNTAAYRPLELDRAIGDKWLLKSGLQPGDRVIVTGLMMLRPGTVVNASEFNDSAATKAAQSAPQAH
ncbi:MAG: efflux RND transporter periplasmic adaptor subunit [Desulfuromonas sp.]|nr:efflux RND transporter periplasmic adaptor subunit [Desulfuromonas sp.]